MRITFCTGCMNRLEHLRETYIKNIKMLLGDTIDMNFHKRPRRNRNIANRITSHAKQHTINFVLLNYNSQDGLDEWVNANLYKYIEDGKLTYIKTNKPTAWSMAHTKNITGKAATGDFICWLDADNFIGPWYLHELTKHFIKNDNIIVRSKGKKKRRAALAGRIAVSKTLFLKVGGYDENMTGWGIEDDDFCKRILMMDPRVELIHILGRSGSILSASHRFLGGRDQLKLDAISWKRNANISAKNIKNGEVIANRTSEWGVL